MCAGDLTITYLEQGWQLQQLLDRYPESAGQADGDQGEDGSSGDEEGDCDLSQHSGTQAAGETEEAGDASDLEDLFLPPAADRLGCRLSPPAAAATNADKWPAVASLGGSPSPGTESTLQAAVSNSPSQQTKHKAHAPVGMLPTAALTSELNLLCTSRTSAPHSSAAGGAYCGLSSPPRKVPGPAVGSSRGMLRCHSSTSSLVSEQELLLSRRTGCAAAAGSNGIYGFPSSTEYSAPMEVAAAASDRAHHRPTKRARSLLAPCREQLFQERPHMDADLWLLESPISDTPAENCSWAFGLPAAAKQDVRHQSNSGDSGTYHGSNPSLSHLICEQQQQQQASYPCYGLISSSANGGAACMGFDAKVAAGTCQKCPVATYASNSPISMPSSVHSHIDATVGGSDDEVAISTQMFEHSFVDMSSCQDLLVSCDNFMSGFGDMSFL